MGNTYLLSAPANEHGQGQASRSTLARCLIRRYVACTTAAEAIAVARQRDRQGIETAL